MDELTEKAWKTHHITEALAWSELRLKQLKGCPDTPWAINYRRKVTAIGQKAQKVADAINQGQGEK